MANTGRPRTVLFVDDSELLVELARFHLESAGLNVITAVDLAGLRQALATHTPDLLICDAQLPDCGDGAFEAALGAIEIPVWLFSGLDEASLAERARAVGAARYITKGKGFESLVEQVRISLS